MSHTILLVKVGQDDADRTWCDVPSVKAACESVLKMYEEHLKRTYPDVANIQYSVDDLFVYLDEFHDLSFMVHDRKTDMYVPHDRDWVKGRIFDMLKKSAA
mmetsp:Transcript_3462/g.10720  ORF Transcript_3462/g.10720 Transcript_3462/m.10720 type:complete len:101 (-) Transcript_3462:154-456(-)